MSCHLTSETAAQTANSTIPDMRLRDVRITILVAVAVFAACGDPTSSNEPGPPATIVVVSGDNQSVAAGNALTTPVVAQVRDNKGRGVPDVPVLFTVTGGGGSLASATAVTTDASGNATAPEWTLGKSASPQILQAATAEGTVTGTAKATVATSFNIEVRFFGSPPSEAIVAVFEAAAARIEGAVTGDVGDVGAPSPALDLSSETAGCGTAGLPTSFSEPVDDLLIYARIQKIDGPNNVLASAFPCFIRDPTPGSVIPTLQTAIGVMRFDSDDIDAMIARGNFVDVVTHEMLHVVGLGTLWNESEYNLRQGAGTAETRYTGAQGVAGCHAVGGAKVCPGSVPLEPKTADVGAGTADSHWSDPVFFNELMTGFVNTKTSVPTGILNPFSLISLQSLADMGYVTNTKAADPYTVPNASASAVRAQMSVGASEAPWETVQRPRFRISRFGKIGRIGLDP
jgi:hypothetical protein